MTTENPFLPPNFEENLKGLPEDHPARIKSQLTVLQSFAFPILMWFFTTNRFLGQGRSYLAAHVLLNLALTGKVVPIDDLSIVEDSRNKARINQVFINTLVFVMQKDFKEYNFSINKANMELKFIGLRVK